MHWHEHASIGMVVLDDDESDTFTHQQETESREHCQTAAGHEVVKEELRCIVLKVHHPVHNGNKDGCLGNAVRQLCQDGGDASRQRGVHESSTFPIEYLKQHSRMHRTLTQQINITLADQVRYDCRALHRIFVSLPIMIAL